MLPSSGESSPKDTECFMWEVLTVIPLNAFPSHVIRCLLEQGMESKECVVSP